jgi:hypothetical protein
LINPVGPKKGEYQNYLSETLDVSAGGNFGANQNAYAINLGSKPYNKKVKNLND